MRSFVVSLWDGSHNVAAISTCDESFADKLTAWAEAQGYRVETEKDNGRGPQHK